MNSVRARGACQGERVRRGKRNRLDFPRLVLTRISCKNHDHGIGNVDQQCPDPRYAVRMNSAWILLQKSPPSTKKLAINMRSPSA